MQYVACRELKDFRDGSPVVYHPGDVIPNFEKWDIIARRAHLNLEWVKPVIAGQPEDQKVFRVTTVEEGPAAPKDVAPDVGEMQCQKCGRDFKSKRAFSTHNARAHKKK